MKNHIYLLLWASFMLSFPLLGQLNNNVELPTSINTTGNAPHASAILDVDSDKRGMLVPRMTTAQRTAITSPATGLLVFDTTTNSFWFYNGTVWQDLSADEHWQISASGIVYDEGTVNINSPASAESNLRVDRTSADYGPNEFGIYSFRTGSTTASNGGTGWGLLSADAAIGGFSNYGNNYSAGIYGVSRLDYSNSAAVIGADVTGDIFGALGYNDGFNMLAGYFNGDARFVNGNVAMGGGFTDEDYTLKVTKEPWDAGPGKSAIFARSATPLSATGGGNGWLSNEVDAAVSGVSTSGSNYTTGIYGNSPLIYTNSAAVIGVHTQGDVFGALAFRDDSSDLWAGYFDGQVRIKQQQSGRAISFENHSDSNYWTLGISAVTDNLYFFYNDVLMSSIRDSDGVYVVNSDRSLKTNIEYLDGVLPKVTQLKPAKYHYKSSVDNAPQKSHGFIAQEVQQIFPELVHESEDGKLALAYDDFAILSIQAIKEQQAIIEMQAQDNEDLKAEVANQNAKIDDLQNQLNEIKAMLANSTK